MSRRTAGWISPLLFTLASLVLGSPIAVAGDLPSASGDTPYSEVSDEQPVKPEAGQPGKAVSPAADVRTAKGIKKNAGHCAAVDKPATEKPAAASTAKIKQPSAAATEEASRGIVGEPLAPSMIEILQEEIRDSARNRGIADNLARFQRYSGYKLDSSAAAYTGSELAGNCRLSWYDHMLRHPLGAVAEAEQFTREVHTAILRGPRRSGPPAADHRRQARPAQATSAKVSQGQDAAGGAGHREAGLDRGPGSPGRGTRPAHQG